MMAYRTFLSAAVFGLLTFLPLSARAALLFCNNTRTALESALGYREEAGWTSEGWWQIQPGQCARVFNKPLTQRFYFYYARALPGAAAPSGGNPPMTWGGKYRFCIDNKAFRISGDGSCEGRGYTEKGFQEIDIGPNQRSYTLSFEDGLGK